MSWHEICIDDLNLYEHNGYRYIRLFFGQYYQKKHYTSVEPYKVFFFLDLDFLFLKFDDIIRTVLMNGSSIQF